jgi:hypothetical protein
MKNESDKQKQDEHAEWILSRLDLELLTPERLTGCIRVLKQLRSKINRAGRSKGRPPEPGAKRNGNERAGTTWVRGSTRCTNRD